jgi:hypothetical protein
MIAKRSSPEAWDARMPMRCEPWVTCETGGDALRLDAGPVHDQRDVSSCGGVTVLEAADPSAPRRGRRERDDRVGSIADTIEECLTLVRVEHVAS